jgi:hypothetical protein
MADDTNPDAVPGRNQATSPRLAGYCRMRDDVAVRDDVRANRRWLIGITITLVFGMFGAVMAILAYTNTLQPAARTSRPAVSRPKAGSATPAPAATPPAAAPASSVEPEKKERRDKNHDRD